MTTKEKVILESIKRVTKQVNEIDTILNANPLSDIIQLERDTINKAKELHNKGKSKEALTLVNEAGIKRKELLRLAKKQQNGIKLIEDQVKLSFELADLKNELWHIERRK